MRVSTSESLALFTSPLSTLRVTKFDAPHLRKVSRLGILGHKRRDGVFQPAEYGVMLDISPTDRVFVLTGAGVSAESGSDILRGFAFRQLKKLRVTRELAFEISQQRKQAYWEFEVLFVAACGAEENSSANRLL